MTDHMKYAARYKLAVAKSRGSHFAIVALELDPSLETGSVTVDPAAFNWLRDVYGADAFIWKIDCDYARGAMRGVAYALANTTCPAPRFGIRITEIQSHDCHGTDESAAVAAAFATWDLLQEPGKNHPIINPDLSVSWPSGHHKSPPNKPMPYR